MKITKRLIACIAVMMIACMMLTACGSLAGTGRRTSTTVNDVVTAEDGYASGEIGTTFRTVFFDYSVDSVAFPSEYEGIIPNEGYQFLDVVITIKNTFGEELPMFNSDFQIQWHDLGDGPDDFDWGLEKEDSDTIMPASYYLASGKSCTYHILYEVPAEAKEFSVSYLELFDDDSEGDVFFTYFNK